MKLGGEGSNERWILHKQLYGDYTEDEAGHLIGF